MLTMQKQPKLLRILIILTCLSLFTQILFLWLNSLTTNIFDTFISASLTMEALESNIVLFAVAQFIFSQLIVYAAFVTIVWYVAISLGELFALRRINTYLLGVGLWLFCVITILLANTYYVQHSFFAKLIQENVLNGWVTHTQLKWIVKICENILLITGCLALTNLVLSICRWQNGLRHSLAIVFLSCLATLIYLDKLLASPRFLSGATQDKPNIIIIGIDAVRPDFTSFYNPQGAHTPHVDAFLQSATTFSEAYAPLARTFPSWTSILTAAYPVHTNARGNNTDINTIRLDETLPLSLKKAGYETIFGTDDTRFNNVNESYGFDSIISPPMGLNDFLIGSLNDFPLSNLLIPTVIGKILFPYNFANHGTAATYSPKNYLEMINDRLHGRSEKPLFLSIHFTLSHWPFYWFNDHQAMDSQVEAAYKTSIEAADKQVGEFFKILQKNNLLDHAVVVLLSDHGLTMGLPGDTVLQKQFYQGDTANIIKLPIAKYSHAPEHSLDFKKDYGVDTCYGYGNNLLSLKQSHALLGFKGYGVDLGPLHAIGQRVSLMDIAPTLLDLLHLPAFQEADGISLTPFIFNLPTTDNLSRPLFFETTFTMPEIEKNSIAVEKVVAKSIDLYQMHERSGLLYFNHDAEKEMTDAKQLGVLEGDWLLVRFPETKRGRLVFDHHGSAHMESFMSPSFLVLVNLKTGAWTTEMHSPFALNAPTNILLDKLNSFF